MAKWTKGRNRVLSLTHYKNGAQPIGSTILKMERGEKWETENRCGLLAECPVRRQRHTKEKLVLLDKDLANLKELRRLNGEGTIN